MQEGQLQLRLLSELRLEKGAVDLEVGGVRENCEGFVQEKGKQDDLMEESHGVLRDGILGARVDTSLRDRLVEQQGEHMVESRPEEQGAGGNEEGALDKKVEATGKITEERVHRGNKDETPGDDHQEDLEHVSETVQPGRNELFGIRIGLRGHLVFRLPLLLLMLML